MNRKQRLIAAVSAGALAVGGAVVAISVAPASADQGRTAQANAARTQVTPAQDQRAANPAASVVARGTTVVTFDAGALTALAPLNPKALRPSALTLGSNEATVIGLFPIVGNTKAGRISHTGGLSLNDGTTTVVLGNFIIDTNATTPVLTAQASVNGERIGRIAFLDVSPTDAKPGCDVSASLSLSPVAGFALADAFGIADLSGASIGQACIALR